MSLQTPSYAKRTIRSDTDGSANRSEDDVRLRTVQRAHDDKYDDHEQSNSDSPVVLALFECHHDCLLDVAEPEEILDRIHLEWLGGLRRRRFFAVRRLFRFHVFDVDHAVRDNQRVHDNGDGVNAVKPELLEQYARQSSADGHGHGEENARQADPERTVFHLPTRGRGLKHKHRS